MGTTGVILTTLSMALQLLNAAEPDVVAIINLFKDKAATLESLLADADKTEQADIDKIKTEIK
jgi:hypothetical protein